MQMNRHTDLSDLRGLSVQEAIQASWEFVDDLPVFERLPVKPKLETKEREKDHRLNVPAHRLVKLTDNV